MSTTKIIGSISIYRGSPLDKDTICPITREAISKPVQTSCGHLFSKDGLKLWLISNDTCPMCRAPLDRLIPLTIREKIGVAVSEVPSFGRVIQSSVTLNSIALFIPSIIVSEALFELYFGTNPTCYFTGQMCFSTYAQVFEFLGS